MDSKLEVLQKDLQKLIEKGDRLYYAMLENEKLLPDSIKEKKYKLPSFYHDYDDWYSEALVLIKQILPDRFADFVRQYKDEKRKELNNLTYSISDYLYLYRPVSVESQSAIAKMNHQLAILKSSKQIFKSSLFDIKEVLQADIFDSELGAAKELTKKGFSRGGGAIAGVVLEKHLGHVCDVHILKLSKKNPSIADYNDCLKEHSVLDTPTWRYIQHLGDLRNLCDHHKNQEPTKENVLDLIVGVEKIIKSVW